MRVFVTGGTGFVGTHVTRALVRAGHTLRVLVRASSDTSALRELDAELFRGSLADEESLAEGVQGTDAVVHIAGLIKARTEGEMLDVNAAGTERLARAALRANPDLARFIFISSIAATGPGPSDFQPLCEAHPSRPVSLYGRSKHLGEERLLSLAADLPVTIFRPPMVYGPYDREVLAFFRMIKRRVMPVMGKGEARLSVIYVEDLARAVVMALDVDHASGSIFFVEDGEAWTWKTLGQAIASGLGVRATPLRLPIWAFSAASRATATYGRLAHKAVMLTPDKVAEMRQVNWLCSSHAIRETLGWAPETGFREGARLTAAWYRSAGWI